MDHLEGRVILHLWYWYCCFGQQALAVRGRAGARRRRAAQPVDGACVGVAPRLWYVRGAALVAAAARTAARPKAGTPHESGDLSGSRTRVGVVATSRRRPAGERWWFASVLQALATAGPP